MKLLAPVILFTFISAPLFAEVYKWVDEDGNTHYSQTPPASSIEVKKIDTGKERDTSDAQEQLLKQTEKADALREERLKKAEEKTKFAEEKKQKQQRCGQARKSLTSYQSSPRLLIDDENGGQRRLPEEERQELISKAKKDISEFCN